MRTAVRIDDDVMDELLERAALRPESRERRTFGGAERGPPKGELRRVLQMIDSLL